ncbi:MAG: rubredoxin [Clostridiales bacterium]|nr:rubredoxin [Clostridiales bacterium]
MLWKCTVCSYYHKGDAAPDKCPKCGAPAEKFVALSDADAQKVFMSERTNDIHMEIMGLTMKIVELSKEGIDLDLDPPCVALFEDAIEEALVIKNRCRAELETHMQRGKF